MPGPLVSPEEVKSEPQVKPQPEEMRPPLDDDTEPPLDTMTLEPDPDLPLDTTIRDPDADQLPDLLTWTYNPCEESDDQDDDKDDLNYITEEEEEDSDDIVFIDEVRSAEGAGKATSTGGDPHPSGSEATSCALAASTLDIQQAIQ